MTKSITISKETILAENASLMTNRAQHAISALVKLHTQQKDQPIPLSLIAEKDHISISYLEQLFAGLRRHGIVKSTLGPGGGYELAKPADEIKISDVMLAAEDSAPAKRSKKARLQKHLAIQNHPAAQIWSKLNGIILAETETMSLHDIAENTADGNISKFG